MIRNSILMLLMSVALLSCNGQSKKTTADGQELIIEDVNVETFANFVNEGKGVVLDVRTPNEYSQGHLANSNHMDFFDENFKTLLTDLDKNTPVYVYCRSGRRSGNAAQIMNQMGFKAVYNLSGGILAWTSAGKPVE